jgi:thiol-disulfide isomerase/thioredoxin
MIRALVVFSLCILFHSAGAAEPKPFDAKSPAAIERSHAGRPYVLVLWSLYCDPCRHEMKLWGPLQQKYPAVAFVLVSTDAESERATVVEFLRRHDLQGVETWMFADEFSERVRYAIDPAWRGELPRTYVYDAGHRRQAQSGVLDPKALESWLAQQKPK